MDTPNDSSGKKEARRAARALRKKTCATGGWRPRHVAEVSPETARQIGELLSLAEAFGDMPIAIQEVLLMLIPKQVDGGPAAPRRRGS